MFEHYEQPCGHRCGMPHRPRRCRHRHVITLPSIKDSHPHQVEELGLIGRQVPPPEAPFDELIDGESIVKEVVLLT